MNQTQEDLTAALQVIKTKGWCQNTYQDNNGHVCAVGAVRVALTGDAYAMMNDEIIGRLQAVTHSLDAASFDQSGGYCGGIVGFNDAPHRRKRQVVRVYKKAIKLAA